MAEAICSRCGASKDRGASKCANCGLDPQVDATTHVRAIYLSVDRFRNKRARMRYREELERIAEEIRAGRAPDYDEAEVRRLDAEREVVESVTASVIARWFVRAFWPGILVGTGLLALYLSRCAR